ncbi:1-phosphofructokinase family hexose kinase [Ornithinimicrobium sp. LYQ121]|uniref:1-phosphofructokinase family hexose kinase n=1 Tax=Ornithinimicrobium sp. LYQ121 TaxID=3378801 RepID=UPI0038547EB8
MIVTLTPNPSIDRSITVPDLRPGEVNRATDSRIDPGGKGINVSRALAAQGSTTTAVFPSGGPEGHLMEELLTGASVPHAPVPVAGTLRMNVALLEPDGTTTKVNEPGPVLGPDDVEALLATTLATYAVPSAPGADPAARGWLVGCGSLPPGAPADLFAQLVRRGHEAGALVAVDTSGAPLHPAVAAGPDLIKPNLEELEELVGRRLPTLGDVRDAARSLVDGGVGTVVVSLGSDGALLVDATSLVHAAARVDAPLSTVGAGDCLLAGCLDALSRGLPAADVVSAGVRWGSAAVALPGSAVPTPDDLAHVQAVLTLDPDLTRSLS